MGCLSAPALYQQNALFTRQANELLRHGLITNEQTRILVEQRNALVRDSRRSLSPFGRVYSEILKPSHDLPDRERLLLAKGSNEAILRTVGKTRALVNRLSISMSYVGRGAVALDLALSAVVIARASPEDRARIVARQAERSLGAPSEHGQEPARGARARRW